MCSTRMPSRSCVFFILAGLVLGWVYAIGRAVGAGQAQALPEPAGPASRRSALVISEIHYHPRPAADSNNLEFIELSNSQLWQEDLSGFRLSGAVQFTFPEGTVLAAGSLLVVAADPGALRRIYGITNVLGPVTGKLGNSSEQVRLVNRSGALLLEAPYSSKPPWPVAPDGGGPSLVLARPSLGLANPAAWAASERIGGSPGQLEPSESEPLRRVMFNELLAHSTQPSLDFVELFCRADGGPVDLSGCHLTDDPTTNKFTFPAGTVLEPGGFLAMTETQLNFALRAAGETVYLINNDDTRVLDAVRFAGQARDVSYGRTPDGGPRWRPLTTRTPGQANSPARNPEVVINEILYAPLSDQDDDQFVELHNPGMGTVALDGWRFVDGIDFTFPTNVALGPGGYLVVARNVARLLTRYPGLPASRAIGNFSGRLSSGGERLALARSESVVSTNAGLVQTNVIYSVVDEVTYGTGGRWPQWTKGGGSSLERIDPRGDGQSPDQWAESDETSKAAWTTVEFSGRLDNGDGNPANALQIQLMGAGECLVDDVEVIGTSGQNLLANPSFETGLSPWTPQGDHDQSTVQPTGGINNSACLHLRAESDGDPGANRVRVPLTTALTLNANATLRAKVRWLRGHPEILLRLSGNYLEAFGTLAVPTNLGTPGTANSRRASNSGPAILDVQHQPILPASNQAVIVTARVSDPDGLGQTVLRYRIDPDTNSVFTLPLVDDGSGGDAVAGDGIFSATIPGQPTGKLVAFYIQATDAHAAPATRLFPNDAPARECLVRFGEPQPASKFGAYHLWVTQATFNLWSTRLKLSNATLDGTFVNGNHRVIYNVGVLYAGSAYHASRYTTPTGTACDYKIVFPPDDPFLGGDEATLVWPGLTGGDPVDATLQEEQTSYWIAGTLGLPFNYQRYVHFYVNGTRRAALMQDTQKPDRDSVRQWFPGEDDGELFKVQIWREYDAAVNNTTSIGATLGNFTTVGGVKKTARYRWAWTPRGAASTMNNFTNLFELVDAVNSPSNTYTAAIDSTVDIEQWMRTFASEHLVGNWDSYGYGNGQNMYAYKPQGGRWKMMIWDMDVSLGNASDSATSDLFKFTNPYFPFFNGDPGTVDRMYKHPKFVRAYWRAIQDAVNGPLTPGRLHPLLDAKAAAFAGNGVTAVAPNNIKNFLATRRDYCLTRLSTLAASFALTPGGLPVASNNPVSITGTAPVQVRDILINGIPVPVTWTSVTSWTAQVTCTPGTNVLVVQGLDRSGLPLSSALVTNMLSYTGPSEPPVRVQINEWLASNTSPGGYPNPVGGAYDDWFELYNPASTAVDLAGYFLTDDLSDPSHYRIPSGCVIAPGGYLLVWADGDPTRNSATNSDLHVNFQLSKSGESIGLFA
ncbi:MAG TPA: lamin tail domain-containing protein, partial [Candidatus Dormibacteraeota bacterium]|nr:lamin tail domain-containing protein [Candidatus Dormibacteraeota bacterium]